MSIYFDFTLWQRRFEVKVTLAKKSQSNQPVYILSPAPIVVNSHVRIYVSEAVQTHSEGDDMKIILASSGLGLANEEIIGALEEMVRWLRCWGRIILWQKVGAVADKKGEVADFASGIKI